MPFGEHFYNAWDLTYCCIISTSPLWSKPTALLSLSASYFHRKPALFWSSLPLPAICHPCRLLWSSSILLHHFCQLNLAVTLCLSFPRVVIWPSSNCSGLPFLQVWILPPAQPGWLPVLTTLLCPRSSLMRRFWHRQPFPLYLHPTHFSSLASWAFKLLIFCSLSCCWGESASGYFYSLYSLMHYLAELQAEWK